MPSRGLLDDVLVAVAHSVRRWTDRVLASHAHETSAVALREPAPPDPRAPREDDTELEGDGPPEHWLQMLRERAPHLLPPGYRRRRVASVSSASPAAPADDEGADGMDEATEGGNEEDERMDAGTDDGLNDGLPDPSIDRSTDEPATRIARDAAREHAPAPSKNRDRLAHPAFAGDSARRGAGEPVTPAANVRKDVPPVVPVRAEAPAATGVIVSSRAERAADRDGGAAPSDARSTHVHPDAAAARTGGARALRRDVTPASTEVADRSARSRRDEAAGGSSLRWYRAPEPASDAAERSQRAPDPPQGATRELRWYRVPDPAPDEATTWSTTARRTGVRERDDTTASATPPRAPAARHDTAQAVTQRREAAYAVPTPAPSETGWRRDAVRDDTMSIPRSTALDASHAVASTLARPQTRRERPVELPAELTSPPVRHARTATPERPSWDLGAAVPGAAAQRSFERAGDGRPHPLRLSSETCAALWPRLPDEADEPDDERPASPWARLDGLWPQLPVDDQIPVEEPPHSDHERDERLRREQRGMRWSERRS